MPAVARIIPALEGEHGVHTVGGVPRELLLGRDPLDLDLVVEGDAAALAARIASRLGGEVAEHGRFGTARVVVGEQSLDIATARRESYAHPGALPDVRPATLAEDLGRRDFTVNAIAASLDEARFGDLTALPGALDDLAAGILRVLHPGAFRDDPTRLLRLARYQARLGFPPEPSTATLAHEAVAGGALTTVSGGRIGAELRLLLTERDPLAALDASSGLGLVAAIDPAWSWDRETAERALRLLPPDARADLLLLGSLAAESAVPALAARLDALELERAERDCVFAVADAASLARALGAARRPSEIRGVVAGAPPEAVALAGAFGAEEAAARWLGGLRLVRPALGGADLIAAGVPEGPAVGRGLQAALDAALDGTAPDRETQLAIALRAARAG